MIKKFNEFIREGFLSKTLVRAKSGEERIEDQIESNINTLVGIDLGLPFLIADEDLIITDDDLFNFKQMEDYRKFFESKGWRVPTMDDLEQYMNEDFLKYKLVNDGVEITSIKTNETVLFKGPTKWGFEEPYWLCDSTKYHEQSKKTYLLSWRIMKDDNPDWNGVPRSVFPFCSDYNRKHIRLIKNK